MWGHMNLPLPQATGCTFTELPNGIWVFCLLSASHKAIDDWVAWQDYLINTRPLPADGVARMILDIRKAGTPPFIYTLQQTRAWRNRYEQLQTVRVKVALVMNLSGTLQRRYVNMIKDGVNVVGMKSVYVEIFTLSYDQAVEWLLQPD